MKEAVSRISTYSADTFGVCSALFELGGMIVIHDPSGCNSTYTTHDEPRWYDRDSLIFISGVDEMDAIMGNDDKFVRDVVTAARDFSPRFIVLLCTPIPLMTGTDMPALALEIEGQTGISTFAAPTNSMDLYDEGISWAFAMLARHVVRPGQDAVKDRMACSWQPVFASGGSVGKCAAPVKVNIIGMTPLDFAMNGSELSIRKVLEAAGMEVISCWAMGSTLDDIGWADQADVNLVVSYGGLAAAQEMAGRFAQPYVVAVPDGPMLAAAVCKDLKDAAVHKSSVFTCHRRSQAMDSGIVIVGEVVGSASLAVALEQVSGGGVRIFCPLHTAEGILTDRDRLIPSEKELRTALQGAKTVIADPMYQPICPPASRFIPWGHEAFSGRIYQDSIPNLIDGFDEFAALVKGED